MNKDRNSYIKDLDRVAECTCYENLAKFPGKDHGNACSKLCKLKIRMLAFFTILGTLRVFNSCRKYSQAD